VGRLPSIAIFVDGDGRIDPLVSSIAPYWRITTCESSVVLGRLLETSKKSGSSISSTSRPKMEICAGFMASQSPYLM